MQETIHIYHTNDVHSHFEYWLRAQNFIKAQRLLQAKKGETSFLMDVGDHIDRSNIFTEATLGKGNVKLLNEAQYDVVTIGNNEGITFAHEELHTLYEEANFEVVVANLQSLQEVQPNWLKDYTILTTKYGTTIGVIGATAQFEAFYQSLNWRVTEPRIAIMQIVEQLKDKVDILICLSHLGKTEDELLAIECPNIDVIFGSHTHHFFEHGKYVGDVLLTGGGKFGQYVGHLTLQFDHVTKRLIKNEAMIECALLPSPKEEDLFLQTLTNEAHKKLNIPLFTSPKTFNKEWFHYSQLSDLFAEAMLSYTKADCALFNAGIFVDSLQKGYVTALDLHRILPHPINLCTIELTATELKEVLLQSLNEEWPQLQFKGLGFRGIVFGRMLAYQMTLNEQRELLINGELADHSAKYTLVTLDLFTFGYFYPSFKYAKKEYYLPTFLREVLGKYAQNKFL